MRVVILAVGRLGRAPEAALARDYVARAATFGRSLGLHPVELVELQPRRPGQESEVLLAASSAPGTHRIACDEHGPSYTSRAFAERIATLRDQGIARLAFMIGGADGLPPAALAAAHERLAFGPQTWPHALARVMLAEQVYRAASLLAGAPYHRD